MHGLIICIMLLWFLCRSRVLPPLSFSILSKIALLGLIGYTYSWHTIFINWNWSSCLALNSLLLVKIKRVVFSVS
jgi:hypothetical protein